MCLLDLSRGTGFARRVVLHSEGRAGGNLGTHGQGKKYADVFDDGPLQAASGHNID